MEKSQGSFIPKSPVRGEVQPRGVRKVYIFTYITFVLFFGTLIAAGATFAYGFTTQSKLSNQKQLLADERSSFNQSDLERVRELDSRLTTAFSILNRQVSAVSILDSLEVSTLRTVQLDGFSYVKNLNNTIALTVNVITSGFNASLFQREIFSSDSILKNADIAAIAYKDSSEDVVSQGREVRFALTQTLTPEDIPVTAVHQPAIEEVVSEVVQDLSNAVDVTQEGETVVSDTEESLEVQDVTNQ